MEDPWKQKTASRIGWHRRILETAASEPEKAAAELFDLLGTQTRHGEALVLALDRHRCFPDRVQVDPKNWHSGTTVEQGRLRILQVGLKLLTDQERKLLLFEERDFTPEAEIAYRFSHELSHHLVEELAQKNPDAKELLELLEAKVTSSRKQARAGFSTIGSLRVYAEQGIEAQVIEDVVELCNMYIRSPSYLRRFLHFLSSTQHKQLRDQIQLVSFKDPEGARLIYDLVETLVTICLKSEPDGS